MRAFGLGLRMFAWPLAFAVLFFAFSAAVFYSYFAPGGSICRGQLPFAASWSASFTGNEVKYYILEDADFFRAKIGYFSGGQSVPYMEYIEIFSKADGNLASYYSFAGGCVSDSFLAEEQYFNPFGVKDCTETRGQLIKGISRSVDESEFVAPEWCVPRQIGN